MRLAALTVCSQARPRADLLDLGRAIAGGMSTFPFRAALSAASERARHPRIGQSARNVSLRWRRFVCALDGATGRAGGAGRELRDRREAAARE